jgi:predicted HNH restriction endonuclease
MILLEEKKLVYETSRRRKLKKYFIERKGGKCAVCDKSFQDCVFDFHHLHPDKKDKTIGQLLNGGRDRIEKELQNCILVCSNCHRIIHHGYEEELEKVEG